MDYLKGTEPELYRGFVGFFLGRMHKAYPDRKIDTISNTMYCLALIVSFRLGYPDVCSMLADYGFNTVETRCGRQELTVKKTKEDTYGVSIPTVLPPKEPSGLLDYKINVLYGDRKESGVTYGNDNNKKIQDDPAVIDFGKVAMRAQCCTYFLCGVNMISSMLTQTINKVWRASVLAVARQGLFFIPVVLIAPRFMGELGIQLAQPICDVGAFLLTIPLVAGVLREMKRAQKELENG